MRGNANVSRDASGKDSRGNDVQSNGGEVRFGRQGDTLTLPVNVPRGERLASFTDSQSGITVTQVGDRAVVTFPMRDVQGRPTMNVIARTKPLEGNGNNAAGEIEELKIEVPRKDVDLSSQDQRVGRAGVGIVATVTSVPERASFQVTVEKTPNEQSNSKITRTLNENSRLVRDVAFAANFIKENLDGVVGPAVVTLTVGRAWVIQFGVESIEAVRIADDGTTQVLKPKAEDTAADPVTFSIESPNGLSTFALVAVSQAPQNTPTPAPPTPTRVPTATPTPRPTVTPVPTPTATAVLLPTAPPTRVPTPTIVLTPTATLGSSPLPTLTPTDEPPAPTIASPSEDDAPKSGGGGCSAARGPSRTADVGWLAIGMLLPEAFFIGRWRR